MNTLALASGTHHDMVLIPRVEMRGWHGRPASQAASAAKEFFEENFRQATLLAAQGVSR